MLRRMSVFGAAVAATMLLGGSSAWGADDNGTGGGDPPSSQRPPPTEDDGNGGIGGHENGGGGYNDNDESAVIGCGPYLPVSSAYVVTIHPTSSTDGAYEETRPYIQAADWAGFQANPLGSWFACTTGTRDWYDYIAGASAAIDFHDQLTPPEPVFKPDADSAVILFDTYVALASNSGVSGYDNMRIDENVGFYDWQARPRRIIWTPGDGSRERSCAIPDDPRPQAGEIPSETNEECRYPYERPSVGEPDSAFQVEVAVEYEIYFRIAPAGAWRVAPGDNPIVGQPAEVAVRVGELQAVAD